MSKEEKVDIHQLKCIYLIFEKQLEIAIADNKKAKKHDKPSHLYLVGRIDAYKHVIGKLDVLFETNNIKKI